MNFGNARLVTAFQRRDFWLALPFFAHARRKFFELAVSRALPGGAKGRGSATAREAVKRIDALEHAINGQSTAGTPPGLIAAQTDCHYADPHHPSRLNDIDPKLKKPVKSGDLVVTGRHAYLKCVMQHLGTEHG